MLREKFQATNLYPNNVQCDTIPSAANFHRIQSSLRSSGVAEELFADWATGDVESNVAFQTRPVKTLDQFRRSCFRCLMSCPESFMKNANYSLHHRCRYEYQLIFCHSPHAESPTHCPAGGSARGVAPIPSGARRTLQLHLQLVSFLLYPFAHQLQITVHTAALLRILQLKASADH